MSVKEGSSSRFFDRLEALRGIAALSVAVGHSMIWLAFNREQIGATPVWEVSGTQARIARFLISVFSGEAAVDIFFVLSGFVLTASMLGQQLTAGRFWSFSVKRLFRIVPVSWLSLGVVVMYLLSIYPGHSVIAGASDWFTNWYGEPLAAKTVIENAAFVSPWLNPNAWTLKVELIASALLPAMVFAVGRSGMIRTVVLLMATLLVGWMFRADQFGAFHYVYMFAVGIAVFKHGARTTAREQGGAALVIACVAAIVASGACFPLWHPFEADLIIVAASAVLIWMIASGRDNIALSVLDFRWVRFLGRISYSFYLLHFIVLYAIANALLHVVPTPIMLRQPLAVMFLSSVLSIASTIPLAVLSFQYVEKPLTQIGRRISLRWGVPVVS
ncbi:acyltransferase family protein [Paraburkholderia sp. CNPSo 3157]|uniref:Acyltransferase family protein n=1 Tax=Paraburkholderia franconis TaxID=2654983 RepID=A0A7X1NEP2_9BURK|nr:acyltransferase [Paraburkholderia franconis]MPW20587.1 acyltransferase family protein [Paraburkholderia franconis]